MRAVGIFLAAFLTALLLTPLVRRFALRFKFLDYVNEKRKIHTQPMPLLGGLSIFVSFFLALILSGVDIQEPQIKGLFIASSIIFVTGLITDIKELSARVRLLMQVLATCVVIQSGIVLSFLPNNAPGIVGEWVLTILWIAGITNAMNCLDGLDGLLAGFAAISGLCFLIIAAVTQQLQLSFIIIALLGSCLGFLIFNFHPARIFLGDSGSTLIGFILANIAIMGDWATDNVVGLTIPILILGVPIFDMVFTTIMRIRHGQITNLVEWMDYVGRDHFHHRLVDLGLHFKGAVFFIYSVGAVLGASAVVLLQAQWLDALLLLFQAALIFILISVLMVVGKRRRSGWHLNQEKEAK